MLIAQISDTHIKPAGKLAYGRVDTAPALAACVAAIAALERQPDLVLATGDLVDHGTDEEYARLRELLAPLGMPILPIPGNHDDRAGLRAAFADCPYLPANGDFLHYVVDDWPVRLIALDTIIPGRPEGELCDRRLAWLEARLAEAPAKPTLVFMHHPPFPTGIKLMDGFGLANAARFAAVIARHKQVERIVAGHVHRAIQARVGGSVASICPSTAHQMELDISGGKTGFMLEPAGYQLHLWQENVLVTHTAVVGGFPGPYPFFDAAGRVVQ